jgi:hypothetical protein
MTKILDLPSDILILIFRFDESVFYASRTVCKWIRQLIPAYELSSNELWKDITMSELYNYEIDNNFYIYVCNDIRIRHYYGRDSHKYTYMYNCIHINEYGKKYKIFIEDECISKEIITKSYTCQNLLEEDYQNIHCRGWYRKHLWFMVDPKTMLKIMKRRCDNFGVDNIYAHDIVYEKFKEWTNIINYDIHKIPLKLLILITHCIKKQKSPNIEYYERSDNDTWLKDKKYMKQYYYDIYVQVVLNYINELYEREYYIHTKN